MGGNLTNGTLGATGALFIFGASLTGFTLLGNFCSFTVGTKGLFFAIGARREVGANGAIFFLYSNVLFLTVTTEDTLGTEGTLGTSRYANRSPVKEYDKIRNLNQC